MFDGSSKVNHLKVTFLKNEQLQLQSLGTMSQEVVAVQHRHPLVIEGACSPPTVMVP